MTINLRGSEKEKSKSKAELALERIANQISVKPEEPVTDSDQEIPTPGIMLDIVISQLIDELNNVSEELAFVMYCGKKNGWISDSVKEEYLLWRKTKQENVEPAESHEPKRKKKATRAIMVTSDGSVEYSNPEDAE